MVARLVECSDYDITYGILVVEDKSENEVQHKIYEIKNRLYEAGNNDWTVNDVLEQFPKEWEWEYIPGNEILEI